jgi:transcriptional regulator with XRE-family HTH domain
MLQAMSVAFADEASRIRQVGHLSDAQIGRAVGAAPSTVRDWFARRSSPSGSRAERVAELAEIVDRLARVVDPSYIPVWLLKPIEALGNRQPLELIARGQARRVAQLISGLESPGAV